MFYASHQCVHIAIFETAVYLCACLCSVHSDVGVLNAVNTNVVATKEGFAEMTSI